MKIVQRSVTFKDCNVPVYVETIFFLREKQLQSSNSNLHIRKTTVLTLRLVPSTPLSCLKYDPGYGSPHSTTLYQPQILEVESVYLFSTKA